MVTGQYLAFASTLTASFVAGSRLFSTMDRKPQIADPKSALERKKRENESNVEFKKLHFRYPTRPEALVLNNFDLEVFSGKTVALVGPSGCGKSTSVQLLQRFYDPEGGSIVSYLDWDSCLRS